MKDDEYMRSLAIYVNYIFQDFESFLRTEVDLVEDDIKLVLDEYNSSFTTFGLQPGVYANKDLSEFVPNIPQPEYSGPSNIIDIDFYDITRKSKLVVRNGIIAKRFDEKPFFCTILGFNPSWDYKHYNEYISQKNVNLSSTNKKPLKCDVIDGSVVNGIREPIFFSFLLEKPPRYKILCEFETIHYKKIKKPFLNTITFYLENDNNEQVDFNRETLNFTLQLIKI